MKTFCVGLVAACALVTSSVAAAFQFDSVTTYSQEVPAVFSFSIGLVTHVQGTLPMTVDLANVNEATSFRIGASSMWNGNDFVVLLGQDPKYKVGATKATINTPSGNVQLSWTATSLTFSGLLVDTRSTVIGLPGFPSAWPFIPLGFDASFSTNTLISVHFQYCDFTHVATLAGTNKVVGYPVSTPSIIPGDPPSVTYVYVNTGKFHVTTDLIRPTIKFNSPAQNTVVTSDNVNVNLTVADNVSLGSGPLWFGAGSVLVYSVNGGQLYSDANTFPGVASTTHTLNLNGTIFPGTNVITFIAIDSSGNFGTNTLVLFYSQRSPITLITNGVGGIVGITNGQMLEIGRNYVITAKPGAGEVLSAWQNDFGDVLGRSNALTFTMRDGLMLTASFASNPFPAVQGNYLGFFRDRRPTPAVDQFGSFKLTLSASGAFSGTLLSALGSESFSGQFLYGSNGVQDAFCVASSKTARNFVILTIATDPSSNSFATISGAIRYALGDGVHVVKPNFLNYADVQAGRTTNATVLAGGPGTYHFSVAPATNDVNFPGGTGFGTLTVLADGTVNGSLTLADGDAPMTIFSSHLVYTGYVPVLVPLYNKGGGFLMTQNLGVVPTDGSSTNTTTATWVKVPGKKFYPNGFSTGNDISTARFTSVIKNAPFGGINIELDPDVLVGASVALNNGAFSPTSTVTGNPIGTVSSTGNVSGTFVDGTISRNFKGLVVPSMVNGFEGVGFFVRSNQTGNVVLDLGTPP
jgi:hypothetical protein